MARRCTVCSHPEAYEIDVKLEDGELQNEIADEFGLSQPALSRHKANHLGRALSPEERSRRAAERLLNDPRMVSAVQDRLHAENDGLSRQDVIDLIETVIRSDMRSFMEWDHDGTVRLKPSKEVGSAALAIKTFKRVGDHMVPVLYDKSALLRLLGAELGLTTEREAQTIRIVHGNGDSEDEKAIDLPPVKVVRGEVTDGGKGKGGDP